MAAQDGNSEYEQFRQTFFEECAELVAELEDQLALLQAGNTDSETLNAVFRPVHSIKAGAGAFGYGALVAFAHRFEAVLDLCREGQITVSDPVAAVLVQAGDILSALVDAARIGTTPAADFGADVAVELDRLLGVTPAEPAHAAATTGAMATGASEKPSDEITYRILFEPNADLFRHANEPLLILRELRQLGTVEASCDLSRLPKFASLDPEGAFLAWSIRLTTRHPPVRIAEVFEFVEDDCHLVIDLQSEEPAASGLFPQAMPVAQTPAGAIQPAPAPVPLQASEPVPPEGAPAASAAPPAPEAGRTAAPERNGQPALASIRVDLARVDRLVNMVGELVITQSMLAQQIADLAQGSGRQALRGHEDLALLTRELQECVMAIRMQPVKSVFSRMPRLVREVSAKLAKPVKLVLAGEQTEVDKTIIEELGDPLTHMIRNAIDHGIESREARIAAGKPEEGTIELSAMHVGSNILIHVADDGAGLNREKMIAKATAKGLIQPGATLTDDEAHELLFAPGFSTAETVTDVSGRGVGMDVVRRNIVNLGGRIQVQSTPGKGTRFTLVIPLTLAVLDGMIVAIGRERYILPLTSIIESYRPERGSIRSVTGGIEIASVRGEYIRLVYLHELFGVPDAVRDPSQGLVVLVETAQGGKIGIVVDELIGQQQVVIKSLMENFDPVQGLSGATILGDGRVALILDIEQLARMTRPPRGTMPLPEPLNAAA